MPELSGNDPAETDDLTRFVRSTTAIELLCLALGAVVFMGLPGPIANRHGALILMGLFAIAVIAFRAPRFFPRHARVKRAIESMTMVGYVTGVLWLSEMNASPLVSLYLLPIILSALTLGRFFTLIQVVLIGCCHVLLGHLDPGVQFFFRCICEPLGVRAHTFLLVAYMTTTLAADVSETRQNLESLAQTDPLTGALNLRAFNQIWQRQHKSSQSGTGEYSLLMIDIDQLKSINDTYGQDAGDSAIVLVAQCAQRGIRATDFLGRMSGDEFLVLLPGATAATADVVVNRIRNNVSNTTLDLRSRMIRCSVSIGVVTYPKDSRDMRELGNLSDRRMARDKELRRPPTGGAAANT